MQMFCQILIAIVSVTYFLGNVYKDIHGSEAKKPAGFYGFTSSLTALVISIATLIGAGAFSKFLPSMFE